MGKYKADYDNAVFRADQVFKRYLDKNGTEWRTLRLVSTVDQIGLASRRIENGNGDIIKNIIEVINYTVITYIQFTKGVQKQIDINKEEALYLYESILKKVQENADKNLPPSLFEKNDNIELNKLTLEEVEFFLERFSSKEPIRITEEFDFKSRLMRMMDDGLWGLIIAQNINK